MLLLPEASRRCCKDVHTLPTLPATNEAGRDPAAAGARGALHTVHTAAAVAEVIVMALGIQKTSDYDLLWVR